MTARLQVLCLPTADDATEPRYALVADHAEALPESDREALRAFAAEAGARGCLVVSGVLDVDASDGDEEAVEGLRKLFQAAMAVPEAPQLSPQAPKLPPVTTTEGRLARVWGGIKPTTDDGDPR